MNYGTYDPTTGAILSYGHVPNTMQEEFERDNLNIVFSKNQISNLTNYVVNGELKYFTTAEMNARDNMAPGYIWLMPERKAVYQWTEEQAKEYALKTCLAERKKRYPSAADLGDAIYWQSKGDNSKMEAYLAAVEQVKEDLPKPE